ncbi:MAG: ATP-dependent DNA helicase RecQ, partial [Bacteroidales bacterium]
MKDKIVHILKQYWGYDRFRPLQKEIILSVLDGKDTLTLLPTGGGKSICFQVPALALGGLCVVVSPLIALMKDQVENLKKRKIKAVALYSGMSKREIELIINNCLFDPEYRFLYLSPERLKTDLFRVNLPKMPVSMIAVDEAHCISQWGYDFRPPYLEIAEIRKFFPKVPVLALTATATPEVVKDIQQKLLFRQENLFQKSFKRDNLTYYVVKEEDKYGRMLRIMQQYPGTGIVYVRNRRKTKEIADFLKQNNISSDYYHAGLESSVRDRKQHEWMQGKIRVIVSTNAFGMGIDKPDVRFVIHLDIPDTLEAYFQEAGRGGRDEQAAVAVMLFDDNDVLELKQNFELSFPPIQTIRRIYHDLCTHYAIAMGAGEGLSFPFDLEELSKEFNIKAIELYNVMGFLEKTGIVFLSEEFNKPSMLHFRIAGNEFENFQTSHSKYEEFTKMLLRSYSGLFTGYVKINEKEIAKRSGIGEQEVKQQLEQLQKMQIVEYHPCIRLPHIIFLQNRIKEEYLYFEEAVYLTRKKVAKERLKAVLRFVNGHEVCRSQMLLTYFG